MSKVPKPKAKQKITTKRKISIVFLSAVVLVAGLLIYRVTVHHAQTEKQFKQDKVRFAQTEKDMADAYAAIVQTAGQPYETKLTKGCDYGSLEYARGPLGCTIAYQFAYQFPNKEVGLQLVTKAQKAVKTSKDSKNYSGAESLTSADSSSADQHMTYGYDGIVGVVCELKYQLYDAAMYNSFPSTQKGVSSEYAGSYTYDCQGRAARPVYPLAKITN